jgi:hypothetical protein
MRAHGLLRVAPVASLILLISALTACATSDYHTRRYRRSHSSPYESMRSMAYELDQRAHDAASAAVSMRRRSHHDDEVAERMTKFARRAEDFRHKVDHRRHDQRNDVVRDLHDLDEDAQRVSDEMRKSRVAGRLWDDWDAVLDTLRGMDRIAGDYASYTTYSGSDWR